MFLNEAGCHPLLTAAKRSSAKRIEKGMVAKSA
jgi:hypothetical protein